MKIINKDLFTYFGNKDREIEKIMENLPDMNDMNDIKNLVLEVSA